MNETQMTHLMGIRIKYNFIYLCGY